MQKEDFLSKIEKTRTNIEKFCGNIKLPQMRRVEQLFPRDEVADIPAEVKASLDGTGIAAKIKPGARIAICAGSRGIANLSKIVKATVDWVRAQGGDPFVMPAMGSHGGATAEGQKDMLATLGVSEETVGAPVISHMETQILGEARPGYPVHMSVDIMSSDGCIIVCRVKPHTAFRGPYESGFMKMLTIGCGKHNGALSAHREGFGTFKENIPLIGQFALTHAPILGGVGCIENAYYKTAKIFALPADQFKDKEPALLQEAFKFMGQIYLDNLDVLMIDEIGKNISGDGMDPNVSGTFATPFSYGGVKAETKVIFGLTKETHGNGNGLGMAEFTTSKVFAEFDPVTTYTNAMTSHIAEVAKIPLVMPNENIAFRMSIYRGTRDGVLTAPRIVHIKNTEHVEFINVSEALWPEVEANPNLKFVGDPMYYQFDENGDIIRSWE